MSYHIETCVLCGGQDLVPFLKARDFHYGNVGQYQLAQCRQCSLVFLDPMYNEAELSQFYPQDYYSFTDQVSQTASPDISSSSFKRRLKEFLGPRRSQTKDPKFDRPGRMLDVGCGSGWFLARMREQGWRAMGVEPSAAAARLGQTKYGLDIFAGALLDAKFHPASFDYIRFNHSFEHVSNPSQILTEVHRILAKNGKLMIGIPNRDSLNARVFGPYWHDLAVPLHTFGYSTRTLSAMLTKHGFKVERLIYNADGIGIYGSLQMFLNRNDTVISSQGRVFANRWVRLLSTWFAYLENALHIADAIEITAVKMNY